MHDYLGWLAGGAFVGTLAACWSYIKNVCHQFLGLMIQRVEIKDGILVAIMLDHLFENFKRSRIYDRAYVAISEYSRSTGCFVAVPCETFIDRSLILWNGWFPMFISNSHQSSEASGSNDVAQTRMHMAGGMKLIFIKGTFDIDKLISEATAKRNSRIVDMADTVAKRFFISHVPFIKGVSTKGTSRTSVGDFSLPWYKHHMYRVLNFDTDDLGYRSATDKPSLSRLIFPPEVNNLIEEVRIWRDSKNWYQHHGIPWKRGWMLYGPPGTGKTALARAFAEDLDLPIYVFNLAQLTNKSFTEAWHNVRATAPCIALIEDIDTVFHGRKNIAPSAMPGMMSMLPWSNKLNGKLSKSSGEQATPTDVEEEHDDSDYLQSGKLTFECLINQLDGIERGEGIFTIITTNDISKVDEALGKPVVGEDGVVAFTSTRPGRIDKAIELTYMTIEGKKEMARRILGDYEDALYEMIEDIERYPSRNDTPAQMQDRCAQLAMRCFWNEKHEIGAEMSHY